MPDSLRAAWVALALGCLLAVPAAAGPFRMMGYDSAAQGQGGPEVAWGHGPGVLYSNPALLTQVEPGFWISFSFVQPLMQVKLMDRPANADVPITFYDSDVGLSGSNLERPLPTAELRIARHDNRVDTFTSYLSLSLVHTLGVEELVRRAFDYDDFRFRFGLQAIVPTSGLVSIASQYPDEREQYFSNTVHLTRFGEWSKVLSLLFGLAVQPVEWLSIGAAVDGGMNINATLDMYIPEATVQEFALVNASFQAVPTVRAVVGLDARPLPWLSVGLSWRDRRYSKVDASALLNLWNYPKRIHQRHLMALDFEPQEVALAVGVRFEPLFAQASLTWNHWADFIDTHHKRAQENAVWQDDAPSDGAYTFSDTFSMALGLGYEYLPHLSLSVGAGWRPTPVPAQLGRTNYADADLFNFALGHRADLDLGAGTLRIEAALQLWYMPETTVYKDPAQIKDEFPDGARTIIGGQPMPEAAGLQTNNPGFPGYRFGGLALAGSLTLVYLF